MDTNEQKINTIGEAKKTYTVNEVAKMLCIGRNAAYSLVKESHFKTVLIGSTIRISKKSFDEWLDENNL